MIIKHIGKLATLVCVTMSLSQPLCVADERSDLNALVEKAEKAENSIRLAATLKEFENTLKPYSARVGTAGREDLDRMTADLKSLDLRWNVFFEENRKELVESDFLLAEVNVYQRQRDSLSSRIEESGKLLAASETVASAVAYFNAKLPDFRKMADRAMQLSLTQQTASDLEKLKARSEMMAAEADDRYQQAKTAAECNEAVSKQFESIENNYIEIQNLSAKIQESVYKPLIQRAKDYLMGFAAVAVLLMFLSMVRSKIKATRELRETMKKTREQMSKNDDSIPSI